MTAQEQITELAELVQPARRAVLFTGAGVSTECGVPDYRSPGGLWSQVKPIEFKDWLASPARRLDGWKRYFQIRDSFKDVRPGRGHRAMADLIHRSHAAAIVTQNIDDLHCVSGVPPDRIIELHGNGTYARCLACAERFDLDWVRAIVETENRAPDCPQCGGIVKSGTVSFGQSMPEAAMSAARAATEAADLFLAIGSSLQVYPAAGFPILAANAGVPLVIINGEETPLDSMAALVVHGDIGSILSRLIAALDGVTDSGE
jgi:NAD-dependent deacetylase